jgi:hypothetical protein
MFQKNEIKKEHPKTDALLNVFIIFLPQLIFSFQHQKFAETFAYRNLILILHH